MSQLDLTALQFRLSSSFTVVKSFGSYNALNYAQPDAKTAILNYLAKISARSSVL